MVITKGREEIPPGAKCLPAWETQWSMKLHLLERSIPSHLSIFLHGALRNHNPLSAHIFHAVHSESHITTKICWGTQHISNVFVSKWPLPLAFSHQNPIASISWCDFQLESKQSTMWILKILIEGHEASSRNKEKWGAKMAAELLYANVLSQKLIRPLVIVTLSSCV